MVAGAYLAIGAALSAATKNQVIAFVLAVAVCFLFVAAGSPIVTEFLSDRIPALAEAARAFSVAERFGSFTRGVIALRDLVYFAAMIGFFLFLNAVVLDHRKADRTPWPILPPPRRHRAAAAAGSGPPRLA
jgi:ABC-2 type transport system permease protein